MKPTQTLSMNENERSEMVRRFVLAAANAARPIPVSDDLILVATEIAALQLTKEELRRELHHLAKLGFVRIAPRGAPPSRAQITLTPKGVDAVSRQQSAANKTALVALLEKHVGLELAITSTAISGALDCDEHLVHILAAELREDGIAVCWHQERGYFIAAIPAELEEACAALRSRAMRTLAVEAKLRHIPLPRLIDLLWLKGAME